MISLPKYLRGLSITKLYGLMLIAACSLIWTPLSVAYSDVWVEPLHTESQIDAYLHSKKSPSERRYQAPLIALERLPLSVSIKKTTMPVPASPAPFSGPQQIGSGRSIQQTSNSEDMANLLQWERMPDGRQIAAIEFVSPGAAGTRLIMGIEKLDPRVKFIFTGDNQTQAVTLTGLEVLESIFRDNPTSTIEGDSKLFSSPYMDGENILLEIVLPEAVSPTDIRLSIPSLSHVVISPLEANTWVKSLGSSGSCNFDSTCRPEWEEVSRGVARMLFSDTRTGNSFVCTGSLLNDTRSSKTPFFLTANHCISSQSVASTLQTFWFYHSTSCNSGRLSTAYQTRTGGATLLFSQASTDTSLLQLNHTPPAGTTFLGWSTALPMLGQRLGSVHHPRGDVAKISLAKLNRYANCNETSCTFGTASTSNYLGVNWSSGVVEPGSSGSGLFLSDSGRQYLVGQLLGGSSSCSNQTGTDFYGRFDLAYSAGMHQYLNASAPTPTAPSDPVAPPVMPPEQVRSPVFRFYNNDSRAHFFTASEAERDYVIVHYSNFVYEGIAFYAYESGGSNTSPVYRFYNEATGSHFYTISQEERNLVIANHPTFIYEGIAWNARLSAGNGAQPLYRFYNTATRSHFYTTSIDERDHVIANHPTYQYEGIGYYTWEMP